MLQDGLKKKMQKKVKGNEKAKHMGKYEWILIV